MTRIITLLFSIFALATLKAQHHQYNLFVGTYTNSCQSKGVYVYNFDTNSGEASFKTASELIINPSFVTLSSDTNFLYTVSENDQKECCAVALNYNQDNNKLAILNKSEGKGAGSCYIINDAKNVITANYGSGSISVFGKKTDGSLTEVKQVVKHSGKGVNLKRQDKPHAHMVYFSPDQKYVLAVDLGIDKIMVYQYDPNSANEVLKFHNSVSVPAGGGPRHLTFSKDKKYVYVLQELDGSLVTFRYENGSLKKVFETSILPNGYTGKIQSADIHISPDGKFLYATNRGEMGQITHFKIKKKGKLDYIEQRSTQGIGPRNFAIDPTGHFLLVAHQYSNDIVVFKRDKKTGSLTPTGNKIDLCSPVCLVFDTK